MIDGAQPDSPSAKVAITDRIKSFGLGGKLVIGGPAAKAGPDHEATTASRMNWPDMCIDQVVVWNKSEKQRRTRDWTGHSAGKSWQRGPAAAKTSGRSSAVIIRQVETAM